MKMKTTNGRIRLRAVSISAPTQGPEKRPAPTPAPEPIRKPEPTLDARTTTVVLSVPSAQVSPPYKLTGVVRVRKAAEIAVRDLRRDTGLSMGEIASELILQAAAVCTIRREVVPMG